MSCTGVHRAHRDPMVCVCVECCRVFDSVVVCDCLFACDGTVVWATMRVGVTV